MLSYLCMVKLLFDPYKIIKNGPDQGALLCFCEIHCICFKQKQFYFIFYIQCLAALVGIKYSLKLFLPEEISLKSHEATDFTESELKLDTGEGFGDTIVGAVSFNKLFTRPLLIYMSVSCHVTYKRT